MRPTHRPAPARVRRLRTRLLAAADAGPPPQAPPSSSQPGASAPAESDGRAGRAGRRRRRWRRWRTPNQLRLPPQARPHAARATRSPSPVHSRPPPETRARRAPPLSAAQRLETLRQGAGPVAGSRLQAGRGGGPRGGRRHRGPELPRPHASPRSRSSRAAPASRGQPETGPRDAPLSARERRRDRGDRGCEGPGRGGPELHHGPRPSREGLERGDRGRERGREPTPGPGSAISRAETRAGPARG